MSSGPLDLYFKILSKATIPVLAILYMKHECTYLQAIYKLIKYQVYWSWTFNSSVDHEK